MACRGNLAVGRQTAARGASVEGGNSLTDHHHRNRASADRGNLYLCSCVFAHLQQSKRRCPGAAGGHSPTPARRQDGPPISLRTPIERPKGDARTPPIISGLKRKARAWSLIQTKARSGYSNPRAPRRKKSANRQRKQGLKRPRTVHEWTVGGSASRREGRPQGQGAATAERTAPTSRGMKLKLLDLGIFNSHNQYYGTNCCDRRGRNQNVIRNRRAVGEARRGARSIGASGFPRVKIHGERTRFRCGADQTTMRKPS